MSNPNKIKGTNWENDLADILNEVIEDGKFKRNAGSGAIGTLSNEPFLTGDVRGEVIGTPLKFKIEAKVRSGGTQLTFEKEWLDKVMEEARHNFSLPIVACKFLKARKGVRYFLALDIDTFAHIVNLYVNTKKELEALQEKENNGSSTTP